MTDPMAPGTWNLEDVLRERVQPKATVDVYLNEAASYAKSQLNKELARAKEAGAVKALEKALTEVDKELEASKYVVHLAAVPSRMREDISSKALSKYPLRPDILGRDDYENAKARQVYENTLIWLAQITDVVNPAGAHREVWTQEEMEKFSSSLPTKAQTTIDSAIKALTEAAEEFTAKSSSVDF